MLDRKSPPLFKKSLDFRLIEPENFILDNGVLCQFIHGGQQDVLKIDFIFNTGKWNEIQSGQSYFAANMLPKGTSQNDNLTITSILDRFGSHLEINPGNDITTISLYTLSKYTPALSNLLLEILTTPIFPEPELDLLKSIYSQNLKINLEKTSYLAGNLFRKKLLGANHPYGRDTSLHDVEKLTSSNLESFYKNTFSDFYIQVSGNIQKKDKHHILNTFQTINTKKNSIQQHVVEEAEDIASHVEKPESIQTTIRMGSVVISRTHPDYPALLLSNHILGGYFGSRLMKNIREEKGLTYGIYSTLHVLKHIAYVVIGADVNKDNRDLTITEITREIKKLTETKVDETELETAKNHFIGSLLSDLNTPFAHAEKHKTLQLFNLPKDYFQKLITEIDDTKQSKIQDVVSNYLSNPLICSVG